MTWIYIHSEPTLWTVGFYAPSGKWHTDSDHNDREEAAKRTHYLNGGTTTHDDAETIHYTADVVLLTRDDRVLLVRRKHAPFKGEWALPGGHVDKGEASLDAAVRELEEETWLSIDREALQQIRVYDAPGRDPRGRYVTVVYASILAEVIQPTAGDDATDARWWPMANLPLMAFDHERILGDVKARRELQR